MAEEKDGKKLLVWKPQQRRDDPQLMIVQFCIMSDLTDPQPTIVRQELHNDSTLQEILWNFCRFGPERRLILSQNPHFYNHLPRSNTNWREFDTRATVENWHTNYPQPIFVLTNTPGRVFLELGRYPRAFDNVWNTKETLVFKSACGKLEGEGIVGASFQHLLYSWCHVEHLAEPGMAVVGPNQSSISNDCVWVATWIHELRQALLSPNNPNVKIRISQCTEPTRGCGCRRQ